MFSCHFIVATSSGWLHFLSSLQLQVTMISSPFNISLIAVVWVIVRVCSAVLRRTVVGVDWRFNNLSDAIIRVMAFAQVVETSVNTNNSPSQDYTTNPDDHSDHNIDSPGFKPFTVIYHSLMLKSSVPWNITYLSMIVGVGCKRLKDLSEEYHSFSDWFLAD